MTNTRILAAAAFLALPILPACGGGSTALPLRPAATPTSTVTPTPVATTSPTTTVAPTATPTPSATLKPTTTPTTMPSATPSASPTSSPAPTMPASSSPSPMPAPLPTPSPTMPPSAAPSPTPQATIALAPATTAFDAAGYQLQFTASESGYTGAFAAASSDCGSIATFSPANATAAPYTFTVTSVAAGTCHIAISDAYGQTTTELVTVTTTGGSINARKR